MKKLLTAVSVLFLTIEMSAQETPPQTTTTTTSTTSSSSDLKRLELGIRFMPTVSSFKMNTSDGNTVQGQATLGFGIGGMLAFNFSNHVGIQTELIYNSLSQKYKDGNLDRKISVQYVNIPVMISLNTGKSRPVNLNLAFGPQMGFNVGSKVSSSGGGGQDTVQAVIALKSGDMGFAYGAGLEFALNESRNIRLDLGFRGVWGFLDVSTPVKGASGTTYNVISETNIKTYSGYVGITFMF